MTEAFDLLVIYSSQGEYGIRFRAIQAGISIEGAANCSVGPGACQNMRTGYDRMGKTFFYKIINFFKQLIIIKLVFKKLLKTKKRGLATHIENAYV